VCGAIACDLSELASIFDRQRSKAGKPVQQHSKPGAQLAFFDGIPVTRIPNTFASDDASRYLESWRFHLLEEGNLPLPLSSLFFYTASCFTVRMLDYMSNWCMGVLTSHKSH
jgi:hypothetical protein